MAYDPAGISSSPALKSVWEMITMQVRPIPLKQLSASQLCGHANAVAYPVAQPNPSYESLTTKNPKLEVRITERPLVGWRVWLVRPEPPFRLRAVHHDFIWHPKIRAWGSCLCQNQSMLAQQMQARQTQAQMINGPGALYSGATSSVSFQPKLYHSCGIYACSKRELLEETEVGYNFPVVGQVWLWGRVAVCAEGFRAEFAYPKAVGGNFPEIAREIAKEYKCDLLF